MQDFLAHLPPKVKSRTKPRIALKFLRVQMQGFVGRDDLRIYASADALFQIINSRITVHYIVFIESLY